MTEPNALLLKAGRNGRAEGWSDACVAIAWRLRLRAEARVIDRDELLAFAAELPGLPYGAIE